MLLMVIFPPFSAADQRRGHEALFRTPTKSILCVLHTNLMLPAVVAQPICEHTLPPKMLPTAELRIFCIFCC
jgi:hypothetical protein